MTQKRPRLSAAEEELLLARVAWGDKSARDRLVLAHHDLVAAYARRHASRSGLAYEDLYQQGMSGLFEAIARFDRSRGTRLSTYATPWIMGMMKRTPGRVDLEDLYPDMDVLGAEEGDEARPELPAPRAAAAQPDDPSPPKGRSHKRARPVAVGPDPRSEALALVLAHAVEWGSLPEQNHYAKLALQQIHPELGPGFGEIHRFRERHLPQGLLAPQAVPGWIAWQAAAEGDPAAGYLRVPLQETDIDQHGKLALRASREAYGAWLAAEAKRVRSDADCELPEEVADGCHLLRYAMPDDRRVRLVRIRGDGVLAELWTIASNLCGHFDAWNIEDAVSFVLSGAVPPLAKIRTRTRVSRLYPAASRIALDIDPRVRPDQVKAYCSSLRVRYVASRDREMSPENLALAVFVECNWHPGMNWADLLEAWHEAHPEGDQLHWAGGSRKFKTHCQRAWQELTGALWPGGTNEERRHGRQVARAGAKRSARRPEA